MLIKLGENLKHVNDVNEAKEESAINKNRK